MSKKKAILLAEKPSLAHDIEAVYKKYKDQIPYDITFMALRGHVCRLADLKNYDGCDVKWEEMDLPVIPPWNGYKIEVVPEEKKRVKDIVDAIKEIKPDVIINACDPDREGEHIFRLLKDTVLIKYFKKEYLRYWNNANTDKEILRALQNLLPESNKANLREAAFCRGKTDYLIGMNFTIASTVRLNVGKTIKTGRIKTVLLHICAKRERDIKNFVPSSRYSIQANYKDFSSSMVDKDDLKTILFDTEKEANELLGKLTDKEHIISELNETSASNPAPQLYKLSDLQIEAGKLYGYTSDKVLSIVQSLYDNKFMTYPRTDLRLIGSEQAKELPLLLTQIKMLYPEIGKYVDSILKQDVVAMACKNKRIVNDKEVEKAGHTALTITDVKPNLSKLTEEQCNIYRLVAFRIVAFFLPPLKEKKYSLILNDSKKNYYKVNYKKLVSKGYTEIYPANKDDRYVNFDYKQGQKIKVDDYQLHEVKATCPSRFTDADLIYIMENPGKYLAEQDDKCKKILSEIHGIGTQATRSTIINSLFADGYCNRKKSGKQQVVEVTDLGMFVDDNLGDLSFCQVDLTAHIEEQLSKVEYGEMTSNEYEAIITDYIKRNITEIKNLKIKSGYTSTKNTLDIKCPLCGSAIAKDSKNTAFFCSKYKYDKEIKQAVGCKFVIFRSVLGANITENDLKKLVKGEEIEKKLKKDGKEWEQALFYNKDICRIDFVKPKGLDVNCPLCSGTVYPTQYGYKCENNRYNKETKQTEGCQFNVFKTILGATINKKDITELIKGKEIIKTLKKDDKKWDQKLKYDKKEKKIVFVQNEDKIEKTNKNCPICGEKLLKTSKGLFCANKVKKTCDFAIWYTVCGRTLSEKDIEDLLTEGKTEYKEFISSKTGKTFTAKLVMDDGGAVKFEFKPR